MAFDPSTLCARTAAGEAELATPSQGLALGQRRVLTLLQNPVAVDELAQKHRLDPDKLSRDLTRLADLKLVLLQGPSLAHTIASAAAMTDAAPMAPVVIGRSARLSPMFALAVGIAAVVLAAGIWYATRAGPAPAETTKPTIAAPAPTPVPAAMVTAPAPPVVSTLSKVNTIAVAKSPAMAAPAPARTLRETAARDVARPPSRTESAAAAPAPAKAATAPAFPAPIPVTRPERASNFPTTAPTETAPVATATAAPAAAPTPMPAADTAPPIQVAAAASSLAMPRPAASTALKAISREPPDFPKEAIADGLKRGLVNARIHVDARGNVTGVDILASQPPKVFDRAARRALLRWQFEPNAAGQSSDLDVDVKFQRD